jgi:hypothetical protein
MIIIRASMPLQGHISFIQTSNYISRSDNDKLLLWKQDLYRAKMVIEQKAENTWVRGGIPMRLVYFRTYLLYKNQIF